MNNRSRVIIMTAVLLIGTAIWLPGLRSRRVTAQSPTLKGSYGFSIIVPYTGNGKGMGVIQGVVTLDGAGNATSSGGITVGVDSDPNATTPQVRPAGSSPGTYTVNPDGTGTMMFPDPDSGKLTAISFVITDGGSQLMLAASTGFGNTVATGIARKQ